MIVVGFEPTPPEGFGPKPNAIDHSATLPDSYTRFRQKKFFNNPKKYQKELVKVNSRTKFFLK